MQLTFFKLLVTNYYKYLQLHLFEHKMLPDGLAPDPKL
jgi:hypothetical protein